jgi:hypothetical protein
MVFKHRIKLFWSIFVWWQFFHSAFSQQNITVSGYVSDAATGERLAGATVFFLN